MSNVFKVSNEDVKHLCDFMGIDAVRHSDVSYSWSDGPYSTHEDDYYKCMVNVWRYVGTVKVKDWNWLKSVVEKIESIGGGYSVVITGNVCRIEHEGNGDFVITKTNSKIVSVYECCISFVRWYNANVK